MAYRPHIVLQWGGSLGTSPEIWSNTLRIVGNSTDVNDLQDLAEAWMPDLSTALVTLMASGGYQGKAKMLWIKANAVDANGHQSNRPTNVWYAPDDFAVTAGTFPAGPPQLAITISFVTGAARGLAARGRVYVPTGFSSSAGTYNSDTFQLSVATCEGFRDAWVTFLEALDNNPGPDFANLRVAVVSKQGSDPGNWHAINGVRVGRVIDTQRRRRNALDEDYVDVAPVDYA